MRGIIQKSIAKCKKMLQESKEDHKVDEAAATVAKKGQRDSHHRCQTDGHGDINTHIGKYHDRYRSGDDLGEEIGSGFEIDGEDMEYEQRVGNMVDLTPSLLL